MQPNHAVTTETGACQKCQSEISVEADRCVECGWEPGGEWLLARKVAAVAGVLMGVLGAGLLILALAMIVVEAPVVPVTVTLFTSFILLVLGVPAVLLSHMYGYRTPTDPDIFP